MAKSETEIVTSPVAKHRRSEFGFEPSYEKKWDSVMQIQSLQKKTPHRYQQSPVFTRKVLSCPAESVERTHHHKHRHHHRRRHHTDSKRHHANSEGDKTETKGEERVHLLSSLPWRTSSDSDSSGSSSEDCNFSPLRGDIAGYSPFYERQRTHSASASSAPLFLRRGKQRARSQGSSPLPNRKYGPGNPPASLSIPSYANEGNPHMLYKATVHMGNQKLPSPSPGHVLSPIEDPVTPQADSHEFLSIPVVHVTGAHFSENRAPHGGAMNISTEFLQVPPQEVTKAQFPGSNSPHSIRKFLGLETGENPFQGLTENEILQSRLLSRRDSSSSESSTSTLT